MPRRTSDRPPPEPGTLGYLLMMRRLRAGWSQTKAGQHFGVSQPNFSKWENNVEEPGTDKLPRMAEWLDLPLEELTALKYDLEPSSGTTQVLADLADLAGRVSSAEKMMLRMSAEMHEVRAEQREARSILEALARNLRPGLGATPVDSTPSADGRN